MREDNFMDREFGRGEYDGEDSAEFIEGLVGVAMPFKGEHSDAVFAVIAEECDKLGLKA